MNIRAFGTIVAGTMTALACSSSSGSGSGSDAGSGGVTYSCMSSDGSFCTQVYAPTSAMSGEQQACAMQMGTFAQTPCPMTGVLGCCVDSGNVEEQCAYTANSPISASICKSKGGTWVGPDGGSTGDSGASGPAAFVGTWARSGTDTITCPSGTSTVMLSGNLVITLGSASDSIVATAPNGCAATLSVSGNIATATTGQMCSITTEGGVAETVTTQSHTLTLSADGKTLASAASELIDKTATMTMCSSMVSGTFTKM